MDIGYQIPRSALLWILISVVLVLAPQTLRMPIWISLIAVLCVVWRLLIFSGRLNYPGRWVRALMVLFTLLVAVVQVRSIGVGLDSAAALLALGFVFKLIEMRQRRDINVVVCLCFVMLMVSFLYSQTVLTTLYVTLCLVAIITAMISVNRPHLENYSANARLAMKIVLQALPLTLVLFLLFPRIAPLWAVPMPASGNSTGVSDEMSPGDISQLGRSSDLAFRVQFESGPPPAHEDLYWRGLVLDEFDGQTWRRSRRNSAFAQAARFRDYEWNWQDRIQVRGEALTYNVIMEPTQEPWIYGLHLAEPERQSFYQSRNFELFNNSRVTKRISYDMRSFTDFRTDLILLSSSQRISMGLPESGNERSQRWARELRRSVNSDMDYVQAVLRYFRDNEFFYTLNPSLLGDERIDDFLFNTREGFCEHYASTFAFLMRAAGIPARVVVGYQGAEYNRYEDYMMVYQYNAHAWNEVWLEGQGWVRFDPTGAVSPERIEQGVEAALQNDPAFLERSIFSAARLGGINWLNSLRLRLDAIEYEWNRRVVNYDEDVQFEVFEQLLGDVTERKVLSLLVALAVVVVAAVAFTVIRREPHTSRDPANRLYRRLNRELSKIGLGRRRGEPPLAYRDRVIAAQPELEALMRELTELYLELNYRDGAGATRNKSLRAMRIGLGKLRFRLVPMARLRGVGRA